MSDLLPLLEESTTPSGVAGTPWKILVIDDDPNVHDVTALALDNFHYMECPIKIISAYSGKQAREILKSEDDIALILLDVVMESEHAGLDLVHFIRDHQHNAMVRIVLRTGQPGQAPPLEVIRNYDIDDYRSKTELTFERLIVVTTSALRTYHLLRSMAEAQARMLHMANHDDLTGLPNRTLLHDRINRALARARRIGELGAILFVDIDGFKFINDSFGHSLGDALLRTIAERLQSVIREDDTVARLGGDEFVIVLNSINSPEDALQLAEKIRGLLPLPLEVDGRSILITASIGLSVFPQDGDGSEELLKNADTALYAAKQCGKNCVQVYSREMSVMADDRVTLENALRQALALNQFELHYQPRVEIKTGLINGIEALIRWTHPVLGTIPTLRFIQLAEEIGLIVEIGQWVLDTACRQARILQDAGHGDVVMAVNISARQFHQQDLMARVQQALKDARIPATSLELELTESVLISNPEVVIKTLLNLKSIGISMSMDDFGTGYSSLNYLNRFPIDVIKIDQSFISSLQNNSEAASITRAIIALAKSLNKKTIAEGVETVEQAEFLRINGCDSIQGFYFSAAVPADDLMQLLEYRNGSGGTPFKIISA